MIKLSSFCLTLLSVLLAGQVLGQNDSIPSNPVIADSVTITDMKNTSTYDKGNPGKIQPVYKLKPVIDIPVTAIGAGWSLYAFSKIYSKPNSSDEKILSLDVNNINSFDRWAVRPFSEELDKVSYYPFFAVMPMPLVFLTGKSTRKDFFKLTFLYLEAMSITGFLYTGSVYFGDRYRPYAYSSESTMDQRTRGGAKNSFYAGHVALVATSTFFGAKVYADYHPDSKIKWLFYTLAGATTATTAYLRYRAGQHFPTDLLLGMAQGTLSGILVPHFHKHKLIKNPNLSIIPYSTGKTHNIAMVYKIR
jgi:hypothetical protein